jgi:aspartate-semialdehyde dehydrogenase
MDNQNSKEKPQTEPPSQDGLVKREWEIINELQKMLKDPDLTIAEKTHVAHVFAYHANTLNKLLTKRGEKDQFEDQTLGDYLLGVEPQVAKCFRRDFRTWKRTFSVRRR